MQTAQLNDQFGIPGQLNIVSGNNGLVMIEIDNQNVQASISSYGGQILAFCPRSATNNVLFLSKQACFQAGKAIRGGIPICWPWFGPDPDKIGSAHGLVRTRQWQILSTQLLADGAIEVVLGIQDSPETRTIWPHSFELSIAFTISQSLNIELITKNTGLTAFKLTQALHTYFAVGDSQKIQVYGLDNTDYIDKTDDGKQKRQQGAVTIDKEVDRIYTSADTTLVLKDPTLQRNINIHSKKSSSAIIWNPWDKKAATMSDLADNEYKTMLCIETANAEKQAINIPAGDEYRLTANYQIV
jgi:glucose-6-phosphate 1-epimerase